jgi:uncharacterized protein YukE
MDFHLLELLYGGGYLSTLAFLAYIVYEIKKKQTDIEKIVSGIGAKKVSTEDFYRVIQELSEQIKMQSNSISTLKDTITQDIKNLSIEKMSSEEFFKMFSGWREEINIVNQKIDSLKDAIIKELIR